MKRLFAFLPVLLLLHACSSPPVNQPENRDSGLFSTSADSRLYFNNIRSINYLKDRNPAGDFDQYHYRKWPDTPLLLPFDIIDNYLHDEAYLYLYPALLESDSICLTGPDGIRFIFDKRNRQSQFQFAGKLYGHLENKAILRNDAGDTVLQRTSERLALRVVLRDYFELVNDI